MSKIELIFCIFFKFLTETTYTQSPHLLMWKIHFGHLPWLLLSGTDDIKDSVELNRDGI